MLYAAGSKQTCAFGRSMSMCMDLTLEIRVADAMRDPILQIYIRDKEVLKIRTRSRLLRGMLFYFVGFWARITLPLSSKSIY